MAESAIPYIPAGEVGHPRPAPPATPELDKRSKIVNSDAHKGLVAFLEWLDSEDSEDLAIVRWGKESTERPSIVYSTGFNRVLAAYYGLDIDKINAEQESLLAYLREINNP